MSELTPQRMQQRLRALVVEDEWPARNYLVELLEGSGLAQVVGAVSTLSEARQALETTSTSLTVDVAFVDVALRSSRNESGLDLIRSMAQKENRPMFVLATAFKEHALEAFNLGVDDYLLKPFFEDRVEQCLQRLRARRPAISNTGPLRVVARRGRSLVFLEASEVWAFEAADRLTVVHTPHGTFDVDLSLASIEASFGAKLTRVHRNWLVSAAHIKELERVGGETNIFVGTGMGSDRCGVKVPIARERAQAIRELLLASATGVRRT